MDRAKRRSLSTRPPETVACVAQAEQQLGHTLPPSLVWLLTQWGYSEACGVDNLAEAVEFTLRLRAVSGLPERFIALNDWQDAGIVFFDASVPSANGEFPVYWAGSHNIQRLASGEAMDADVDAFPDFPAWVASRWKHLKA